MSYRIIHCASREEWLDRRKPFVTSTESSALFDLNPYMTAAQLWVQKYTQIFPIRRVTQAMQEGLDQEDEIAREVARRRGWNAKAFPEWMLAHMLEVDLASSYDWAVKDEMGVHPYEIKKIHFGAMGKYWRQEGGRVTRVSDHVEFQLQVEMRVCEFDRAKLGVKCGEGWYLWGEWKANYTLQRAIVQRTKEFMDSVKAGIPPKGATRTRLWHQYLRQRAAA